MKSVFKNHFPAKSLFLALAFLLLCALGWAQEDELYKDGLKIRGRISLPPDYQPGTRIPGVFWTYPREYSSKKDYKTATIRSVNLNSFRKFSYRNASEPSRP